MQQINLSGRLKRTLKNSDPLNVPDLDIFAQLNDLECFMSLKSAKLLFAILNENLNEASQDQTATAHKKLEDEPHAALPEHKRTSIYPNPQQTKSHVRRASLPSIKEIQQTADRINMKLIVDLKRIKLIIVELISIKAGSSSNGAILDMEKPSDGQTNNSKQLRINNPYKIINFGLLEIQDVHFNYFKNVNLSWYAQFKMKDLKLNDVRPDSNLAVKE